MGIIHSMEEGKKVELLSPAGSMEGFYGAVHAGADAVYLGGNRFGARAYAENFTREELLECIRYGHLLNRKVYLTVNTLLKDSEMGELYDYMLPFYRAGLDAVIVQDLGVLRFIRRHFPGLKLHVSTQMTICGSYGASLLKEMGASRIVPARELGLQELVSMKEQADIEIETFIHGAMCYCYSGQCLFSSILGGRSGNRGRCAQPCRLPYSLEDAGKPEGRECYPLSLKDMCTIEHIPLLAEAGIDSFKIEGRMKKPEYTAGVTAIYRHYIDLYYRLREQMGAEDAAKAYKVERPDLNRLASLYIRTGIQDGYYFRRNGREMVTLESPAYSGSDDAALSEIRKKYIDTRPRIPVEITAVFRVGRPAEVTFRRGKFSGHVTGSVAERASRQPVTEENIRKQLCKLGDSLFSAAGIRIEADADCFYSLKQINEMRRAAVGALERQILRAGGYNPEPRGRSLNPRDDAFPLSGAAFMEESFSPGTDRVLDHTRIQEPSGQEGEDFAFSVCTLPQLEALAEWFSTERHEKKLRFYIDGDLFLQERQAVRSLCGRLPRESVFFVSLPCILRETDRDYLDFLFSAMEEAGIFQGFLVRSMDGLGFVRERGKGYSCRTDAGVYVWNKEALQELSSLEEGFCLPYELRGTEQRRLLETGLPCEKIVYGRIPMMVTANCLYRTFGRCRKAGTGGQNSGFPDTGIRTGEECFTRLKDRYRNCFPVFINCAHCMNIIYNSVPLSLHQTLSKYKGRECLRMDFTLESPGEVKALLDSFLKGKPFPHGKYTTGHEKRGVE